jgi:hypothetical protein
MNSMFCEKIDQQFGLLKYLSKNAQSLQLPKRRKFVQSGHTDITVIIVMLSVWGMEQARVENYQGDQMSPPKM